MIYTVKHKPFYTVAPLELPEGYKTICVGGYSEPDGINCTEGKNIENLNKKINELTALYWIWKNTKDPIVGLAHYRRFLLGSDGDILTIPGAKELLKTNDIICHSFNLDYLTVKRNIIMMGLLGGQVAYDIVRGHLPDGYQEAFAQVMESHHYYVCHLFVTKREILNEYCKWLFSFITDAAKDYRPRIGCDPQEIRAIGYIAEALLSVWALKNGLKVASEPMRLIK